MAEAGKDINSPPSERRRLLGVVQEQLAQAVAARKCHACGCLHSTVAALEDASAAPELQATFGAARQVFEAKKYDCLGCTVCFPAIAANAFSEAYPEASAGLDLCPTEAPEMRAGWPPLPGDFEVLRYGASVAVCALTSVDLMRAMLANRPPVLSIVGTMHTENLGVERIIKNVIANPNIRFLVVCGEDSQQAIGHLPGQSMIALARNGIDAQGRIIGARGKRPVLKNVSDDELRVFRAQVEAVDLIGEMNVERVLEEIERLSICSPGPLAPSVHQAPVPSIAAQEPERLVLDPAGFFVIYPDTARRHLVVEHYTNSGVLDAVIEGKATTAIYSTIVERGLVTRLDHAAYLGRELARAEYSIEAGLPYTQDRAAGMSEDAPASHSCGCGSPCGGKS